MKAKYAYLLDDEDVRLGLRIWRLSIIWWWLIILGILGLLPGYWE